MTHLSYNCPNCLILKGVKSIRGLYRVCTEIGRGVDRVETVGTVELKSAYDSGIGDPTACFWGRTEVGQMAVLSSAIHLKSWSMTRRVVLDRGSGWPAICRTFGAPPVNEHGRARYRSQRAPSGRFEALGCATRDEVHMSCNCAECSHPDVTCAHRFEDASGNRVYLNCQSCGFRDPLESPAAAPDRTADLEAALRDLVAYVDTAGGYMTHEHQAVLWRARAVLGTAATSSTTASGLAELVRPRP